MTACSCNYLVRSGSILHVCHLYCAEVPAGVLVFYLQNHSSFKESEMLFHLFGVYLDPHPLNVILEHMPIVNFYGHYVILRIANRNQYLGTVECRPRMDFRISSSVARLTLVAYGGLPSLEIYDSSFESWYNWLSLYYDGLYGRFTGQLDAVSDLGLQQTSAALRLSLEQFEQLGLSVPFSVVDNILLS